MARLFNGSSDKIVASSYSQVRFTNATPFTVAGWFYITVSQNGIIMNFQQNVSGQFFVQFNISKTGSNLKFQGGVGRQNVGQNTITGGTLLSLNTWYHGILTYDTSVENLYLNGVSDSSPVSYTQGTSTAATGNINIGQGYNGATFFGGKIGECAAWNVVLSAGERAALAAGVPASRIRPNALIMYYPIWGTSPEVNLATVTGKTTGTVTGTTVDTNPPVSRYSSQAKFRFQGIPSTVTGGGGGGFNALLIQKYFDKKYTPREQQLQIHEEVNESPLDIHLTASRTREIIKALHLDLVRKRTESVSLLNSVPQTAFKTNMTDFNLRLQVFRIMHSNPRLLMLANRIKSQNKVLEMSIVPKTQSEKEQAKPSPKRETIKDLIDDFRLLDSID